MSKPRSRGLLAILVGAVLLLMVGTVAGVYLAETPTVTSVAPISPVSPYGEEALPADSSAAPPAPPSPVVRHDSVAQSMPKHLLVQRNGEAPLVDLDVDPVMLTMTRAGPQKGYVVPRTLPGWHGDVPWSVKPGTGVGTTVIVGHAEAGKQMAFNPLTTIDPSSAASAGYEAVLTTETGTLTYELTAVPVVGKEQLRNWDQLTTNEPDRLLLVTCDLENSRDTFNNRILVFKLSSSVSF